FAVVLIAPVPMGANRDWAWSPIAIAIGALAVWHASGLGTPRHAVRGAEWPLLVLVIACYLALVAMALVQMSPSVPVSWKADVYARDAMALDRSVKGVVAVDDERASAIVMKIAACGAVFAMARSIFQESRRARLFLLLFVVSEVVVTAYGLFMQGTTGSCY